jgi:hypothetical protein
MSPYAFVALRIYVSAGELSCHLASTEREDNTVTSGSESRSAKS